MIASTIVMLVSCSQQAWSGDNGGEIPHEAQQRFEADYQVKTSFFPLPIRAVIVVERVEPDIYLASVKVKSPFFKVDQIEKARIVDCNVQLLEVESEGDRVGAKPWKEHVIVDWPERVVNYRFQDMGGKENVYEYQVSEIPTGFVSFFAQQYVALSSGKENVSLVYTQSEKGWLLESRYKGVDKDVSNKFYKDEVNAHRFLVPRRNMDEKDMPNIWYKPGDLGSFPLKMAMKLGVFRLEVKLKEIDGDKEEIQRFFRAWNCSAL